MRIGAYQFASSFDIEKNFECIIEGIETAATNGVRLLVFHECALTGYPPIETPHIKMLDFKKITAYEREIENLARVHNMFIALGTIREDDGKRFNSIKLYGEGGFVGHYDKRALWGWDLDNFTPGSERGVFVIDGVTVGFRICFEVRFPEYFRELYRAGVELCFVSFSDVSENENPVRYGIIRSHLITRAVENVMTIVSANSISKSQTAPTAVILHSGHVVSEAPENQAFLIVYDYTRPETSFGMRGIHEVARNLIK